MLDFIFFLLLFPFFFSSLFQLFPKLIKHIELHTADGTETKLVPAIDEAAMNKMHFATTQQLVQSLTKLGEKVKDHDERISALEEQMPAQPSASEGRQTPVTANASVGRLHRVPQPPARLFDVAHAEHLANLVQLLVRPGVTSVGISSESTHSGSIGGDDGSTTALHTGAASDGAGGGDAAAMGGNGAAAAAVPLLADPVAVKGFGGAGKTVLAIRVCNQKAVQSRFKDGIFWINVGQHADGKTEQSVMRQTCALLLKESAADSAAAQKGGMLDAIRDAAAGRSCLFCFDDVWDASDVNKITHAIQSVAPGSKILLTTRDAEVTRDLDGSEFPIAELSPEAAAAMLKSCARKEVVSAWDPGTADLIAKSCGYLPALLAVIGRVLTPTAGKCSLQNMPKLLAQALRDVDRKAQSKKALNLFGYQHKTIVACLEVGVNALEEELRAQYLKMSVFPEDAVMPFQALRLLWGHEDEDDTRDTIRELCDKSLLKVGWMMPEFETAFPKIGLTPIGMTMHNLQYRYLREEHGTPDDARLDVGTEVGQCWQYYHEKYQCMQIPDEPINRAMLLKYCTGYDGLPDKELIMTYVEGIGSVLEKGIEKLKKEIEDDGDDYIYIEEDTATEERDVEKAIQQSLKDQGTAVPDGFFAPVEPHKNEEPAELCTNPCCARLQATAGNVLKMCTVCWKSVAAPSNDSAAVMKSVIQKLFLQLTKGCGQGGCENQHCANAEGASPLAPNVAVPSVLAMARNAQSAGISLCVSTGEKLRKKKVEALAEMGFPMRWCAAALERADGSVDAAAAWLCSIETPMA